MSIIDTFTKTYSDRTYSYTTTVRHRGTVIAFALSNDRRIYYSVLDFNSNANNSDQDSELDVNAWLDDPLELKFPTEIVEVGAEVVNPRKIPLVDQLKNPVDNADDADSFYSSTARLMALAPFQVLSDNQYLYVFRQAIAFDHPDNLNVNNQAIVNNTLLCDRFLLVGNSINPKMEVRFQRSRNKTNPQSNKDTLGAKDMDEQFFYEPTQELSFVENVSRFSVLLLPTANTEVQRWQIFTINSVTKMIDSFNVERAKDGLFNTQGTQFYTSPDPEYQSAVFEREAGICPFTQQPLIPILQQSYYAESALQFNGTSSSVKLATASQLGLTNQSFTVEAWIKGLDFPVGQYADSVIMATNENTDNNGLHLVVRNQKAYMGFYNNDLQATTTLVKNRWYHIAWRYDIDTQEQAIFVNGVLDGSTTQHAAFQGTGSVYLGSRTWGDNKFFKGVIDEVRIWNRARSASELARDMNSRLVGNETGLRAYWRMDEGSGNQVYDQTRNALHGQITNPIWISSDAPVSDQMGMQRTSFRIGDRDVVTGLSALLYYQQGNVATGYDQQEKPLKQNARVMLTMATLANPSQPDDKPYIATIDMGISREGKLAQLPDNLQLGTPLSGANNNLILENLQTLESKSETLRAEIAELEKFDSRKLIAPDGKAEDRFGAPIAVSGDWGMLGSRSGVYIFSTNTSSTSSPIKLRPSNATDNSGFNSKFDISTNWAVVGSSNSLSAHFFRFDGSMNSWTTTATQKISIVDQYDTSYGCASVAIAGDWAMVANAFADRQSGIVYLLHCENQMQWVTKGTIQASDKVANTCFGRRIAMSGSWAIVASITSVYLFNNVNGQWSQSAKFPIVNASIAINGNWAIAGDADSGVVYLFNCQNGLWKQVTKLSVAVDGFGESVAINGDYAVVGTRNQAAYLFKYKGQIWQQVGRIDAPSDFQSDVSLGFGQSVAVTNDIAIIDGFRDRNINGQNAGAAYIFSCQLFELKAELAATQAAIAKLNNQYNQKAIPLKLLHTDPMGFTVTGGLLSFATSTNTPHLFDSGAGKLSLYFRGDRDQFYAAYFDTLNTKSEYTLSVEGTSNTISLQSRSAEGDLNQASIAISNGNFDHTCKVIIENPTTKFKEIWCDVPRQADRFAAVLNGRAGNEVYIGKLSQSISGAIANLPLANGSRQILNLGDVVRVGQSYFTVSADTSTSATAIAVQSQTVTEAIAQDTEIYYVPYDYLHQTKVQLVKYQSLAVLGASLSDTVNNLTLSSALKQSLAKGDVLLIDGVRLKVSAAVAKNATQIPINSITLSQPIAQGEKIYLVGTETTSLSHSLRYGSLNLIAAASGLTDSVINGFATLTTLSTPCVWVADSPGRALSFDGVDDYVSDKTNAAAFATNGDLTLEAWVLPKSIKTPSRLVHHYLSNQSGYTLGIRPQMLQSALMFSSTSNYIAINNLTYEGMIDAITIEAWVKITNPSMQSVIASWDRNEYWELAIGSDSSQGKVAWSTRDSNSTSIDECVGTTVVSSTAGEWHFISVTYESISGNKCIYVDGQLDRQIKAHNGAKLGSKVKRYGFIGASSKASTFNGDRNPKGCQGAIDEVRIWNYARTANEIQEDMSRRLTGDESGLVGYWHFDDFSSDRTWVKDYTQHGYDGKVTGSLTPVNSPLPAYSVFAGVGNAIDGKLNNQFIESTAKLIGNSWNHLAMIFNQSYGLKFSGSEKAYLRTDKNSTLDINSDLTLELNFTVNNLNNPAGLISKGKLQDGNNQYSPYSLYIDRNGKVVFAFENQNGELKTYTFKNMTVKTDAFYKLVLVRQSFSENKTGSSTESFSYVDENGNSKTITVQVDKPTGQQTNYTIDCYLKEQQAGAVTKYQKAGDSWLLDNTKIGNSSESLQIGRVDNKNEVYPFKGIITELRIWSRALEDTEFGASLTGSEQSLIGWWQMQENDGNIAYDSKSNSHLKLQGNVKWTINPDPLAASFKLYSNGEAIATKNIPAETWGDPQFTLGGFSNNASWQSPFNGILEETRIWKTARTEEQILDNLFTRLKGEKKSLIAYYPFDLESNASQLTDAGLAGLNLNLGSGNNSPSIVLSTAPISDDTAIVRSAIAQVRTSFHRTINSAPSVQEYGDLQSDRTGMTGVLKRCYSFIRNNQWHLLTGYKVGNLISEWIGQVQYDPQIVGYVEGAPPVPSENLTVGSVSPEGDDYLGITSLEITEAESVTYTFATSKESSFNSAFELAMTSGFELKMDTVTAPLGFGVIFKDAAEASLKGKLAGNLSTENSWLSDSSHSYGTNTTDNLTVALDGTWEAPDPENANKGLHTGMLRRFQPANTGFAIVESETADVFALRLEHNHALISLNLTPNPDIPKDRNLIPFPINPRYTKQGTLDGAIGYNPQGQKLLDPDYANASGYGEYSYFKPMEAYALKQKIQREEEELRNYYENYDTSFLSSSSIAGGASGAGAIAGIGTGVGLAGAGVGGLAAGAGTGVVGAAAFFAASTTATITAIAQGLSKDLKLDDQFAKRNLVNTAVWTASGGFYCESTEISSVRQETKQGTFKWTATGASSLQADYKAGLYFGLELNGTMGGGATSTKQKSAESSSSFGINLTVNTPTNLQAYDDNLEQQYQNGKPVIAAGKVDAYRFMTFYLDSTADNGADLFNKVIDPIWLEQSNSANAFALRQAKESNAAPDCWRVFHRVTFISRILPEFSDPTAPPANLEQALSKSQIQSNWLLIQKLKPFVENKTTSFSQFRDALYLALERYMPEFVDFKIEILDLLLAYFGVVNEL